MNELYAQMLLRLVKELLANGAFYYSAIEQDTHGYDFEEWKHKAMHAVALAEEEP